MPGERRLTVGAGSHVDSVSVVIPALNAASWIEDTLHAIRRSAARLAEETRAPAVEVVVSDDGSDDGTGERANRFGWPVAAVVRGERSGPAAARNRGAAAATGDVLIFLDSDDTVLEPWLTHAVAMFDAPTVGIASWGARVVGAIEGSDRPVVRAPYDEGRGPIVMLPGCFAVRRAAFEDVGGYDERLRFGENSDLCERILRLRRADALELRTTQEVTIEMQPDKPPGFYDRERLAAMEYLLERDADLLRSDPQRRSRYRSIATVNAARCGRWSRARVHGWHAVRDQPSELDAYGRLLLTLVPPLGRRVWGTSRRRGD